MLFMQDLKVLRYGSVDLWEGTRYIIGQQSANRANEANSLDSTLVQPIEAMHSILRL